LLPPAAVHTQIPPRFVSPTLQWFVRLPEICAWQNWPTTYGRGVGGVLLEASSKYKIVCWFHCSRSSLDPSCNDSIQEEGNTMRFFCPTVLFFPAFLVVIDPHIPGYMYLWNNYTSWFPVTWMFTIFLHLLPK
jgi:hypothetical protein